MVSHHVGADSISAGPVTGPARSTNYWKTKCFLGTKRSTQRGDDNA